MLQNPYLRYAIYGTSFMLISELVYQLYLMLRKNKNNSTKIKETAETILVNELTETCYSCRKFRNYNSAELKTPPKQSTASDGQNEVNFVLRYSCPNKYCSTNHIGKLIAYVDNCKISIDLAMYTFTSHELCSAFLRAIKRGVRVRIISDKEMVYSTGSQIITLTKAGVPVRCQPGLGLMHHKFCILDGMKRVNDVLLNKTDEKKNHTKLTYQGIAMNGSLNWTMQGFCNNWENIFISSNENLISNLEDEFQRMWTAFEQSIE